MRVPLARHSAARRQPAGARRGANQVANRGRLILEISGRDRFLFRRHEITGAFVSEFIPRLNPQRI